MLLPAAYCLFFGSVGLRPPAFSHPTYCCPDGLHRPSSTGATLPSPGFGVGDTAGVATGRYFDPLLREASCDGTALPARGSSGAASTVATGGATLTTGGGACDRSSATAAPPSRGPSDAPRSDTSRTTVLPSTVSPTRNICAGLPSTAISAIRTDPLSITPANLKRSPAAIAATRGTLGATSTATGAGAMPPKFAEALTATARDGSPTSGATLYSAHATPPATVTTTQIHTVCTRADIDGLSPNPVIAGYRRTRHVRSPRPAPCLLFGRPAAARSARCFPRFSLAATRPNQASRRAAFNRYWADPKWPSTR